MSERGSEGDRHSSSFLLRKKITRASFPHSRQTADLSSANASEEEKVRAMMSQAGEEFNPALYVHLHYQLGNGHYLPPAAAMPSTSHEEEVGEEGEEEEEDQYFLG